MNGDVFKQLRENIANMSPEVKDRLILTGIIGLYDEMASVRSDIAELRKMVPLYKAIVALGTILVGLVATLLWSVFTGQAKIVF